MATRVLGSINNLDVQESQLRTKRNLLEFTLMNSGALLLGLAKSIYYYYYYHLIIPSLGSYTQPRDCQIRRHSRLRDHSQLAQILATFP